MAGRTVDRRAVTAPDFAPIGHARGPPADREDMDTFTALDRASLRTHLFELLARDEDEGLPPFWD